MRVAAATSSYQKKNLLSAAFNRVPTPSSEDKNRFHVQSFAPHYATRADGRKIFEERGGRTSEDEGYLTTRKVTGCCFHPETPLLLQPMAQSNGKEMSLTAVVELYPGVLGQVEGET